MVITMKKLNLISLAVVVALAGCSDDDDKIESLTVKNTLAVGSEQCINGGIETLTGDDSNQSGELDADEVTTTTVVCNDAETSLNPQQLAPLTTNTWYKEAHTKLASSQDNIANIVKESGKAKNVILFVWRRYGDFNSNSCAYFSGSVTGQNG